MLQPYRVILMAGHTAYGTGHPIKTGSPRRGLLLADFCSGKSQVNPGFIFNDAL
jgi:hypothetical protein